MSDFLPYGRQHITEQDVDAVAAALREPLITQGPRIDAFERKFADAVGARHAVAFANGTAALHGAAVAAGLGPGDELVTTPLSFIASANCALFTGARPRFHDVDWQTCNLDVATLSRNGAKACVAVSLAGLPVDLEPLQEARRAGMLVIEDACHALGATRAGRPVGGDGLADISCFSLHPVKTVTTGEGGVATTESDELAERLRVFRTHGIERRSDPGDPRKGPWHYDVDTLGFNYRITDFQCALGSSQLDRLDAFVDRRNEIAARYHELLEGTPGLTLPARVPEGERHGYHLFVVRFDEGAERRAAMYQALRDEGIGTQLHYIPIYRHGVYRDLGYGEADAARCPNTERYYDQALSVPMFPEMTDADVDRVAATIRRLLA